jgi:branched-chain amino acid transport system substrate-binding protein
VKARRNATAGRRRVCRPGPLVSLLLIAVALTGCQLRARLGVPTTVEAVNGRCDTSAVVEVGASLPLSGPLAAVGRAELTGLELGVEQVNDSGGVLTSHRCLELMYKDDRSDPAVDNQALLDLVNQERVSLVVGPFLALGDRSDRTHLGSLGVTAMSFSSVDETFDPRSYPYTFPAGSSLLSQSAALVTYAKRHHWQRITAVSSGSATSLQGVDDFIAATRGSGIEVSSPSRFIDSRATASSVLAAIGSTHPEALVVFDDGSTLAPLLTVRRAAGSLIPIIASTDVLLPELPASELSGVDEVEPSALEVTRSIPSNLASFRVKVLRALHMHKLRGTLMPFAQAHDSITMFAAAVNGENADDPGSLRTYLENANYQGILGSYNFTSGAHSGLDASQETVLPLDSLSNGVFVRTLAH